MLEKLPRVLGEALGDVRAGLDKTLVLNSGLRQGLGAIAVGSLAFGDHMPIPAKYTADGAGTSPPLHWSGVPANAVSVAIIVEDADSPTPQPLVHALVLDLPGGDGALPEAALDGEVAVAAGVQLGPTAAHPPSYTVGRNSMLQSTWLPPDPPPGHGVHRYVFQVFALGPGEALGPVGRDALRQAIAERAIACGSCIGTYERADTATVGTAASTAATA